MSGGSERLRFCFEDECEVKDCGEFNVKEEHPSLSCLLLVPCHKIDLELISKVQNDPGKK